MRDKRKSGTHTRVQLSCKAPWLPVSPPGGTLKRSQRFGSGVARDSSGVEVSGSGQGGEIFSVVVVSGTSVWGSVMQVQRDEA